MKKGTLCLLADLEGENFCRSIMLDGAMNGGVGVAAGSLPRHISLGLPYEIKDWDAYLAFAERLASELNPVSVVVTDIACAPIGTVTGNYCLKFEEEFGLEKIREDSKQALRDELGLDIPEKDGVTGSKNITLGFGTAPFENYKQYVEGIKKEEIVGKTIKFTELGVFYYDQPTISASTFFCCKRFVLK